MQRKTAFKTYFSFALIFTVGVAHAQGMKMRNQGKGAYTPPPSVSAGAFSASCPNGLCTFSGTVPAGTTQVVITGAGPGSVVFTANVTPPSTSFSYTAPNALPTNGNWSFSFSAQNAVAGTSAQASLPAATPAYALPGVPVPPSTVSCSVGTCTVSGSLPSGADSITVRGSGPSGAAASQVASLSSGTYSASFNNLAPGSWTFMVDATNLGGTTTSQAPSPAGSVRGVPTIQFAAGNIPSTLQTLQTLPLSASSSNNGPITYSVTGPCSISSGTLTANSPGTCVVTASTAASGFYDAGSVSSSEITVSGQIQTAAVSVSISPSAIRANQTGINLSGSGGNGTGSAQYTFTSTTPNVCSVSGSSLSTASNPTSTTCTISVVRTGSGAYVDSTAQSVSFTLDTSLPSAAAGPFSASVYGAATGTPTIYTFQATDTGGTVTYSMTPITGFAINSSTGVVTKTATVSGNQSLTLRATDPAGNYVERVLNVSVAGTMTLSLNNSNLAIVQPNSGNCPAGLWGTQAIVWSGGSYPVTVTPSGAVGTVTYSCSPTNTTQLTCRMANTNQVEASFAAVPGISSYGKGSGMGFTVTATSSSGQTATVQGTAKCVRDIWGAT